MVGNVVEQAAEVELSRVGLGDPTIRGGREPAAGNDHTVKRVSPCTGNKASLGIDCTNDKTSRGVDGHCFARIVKPGVEQDHVSPFRVIRDNDRVTNAVVDCHTLPYSPSLTFETLGHVYIPRVISIAHDVHCPPVRESAGRVL